MLQKNLQNCKKLGVMRGFQKGITLGDRPSYSGFAKMGCKKICKNFASELGFKLGIMRGFQKGITLGDRTSANFYLMGLQNRVAKILQIFCI